MAMTDQTSGTADHVLQSNSEGLWPDCYPQPGHKVETQDSVDACAYHSFRVISLRTSSLAIAVGDHLLQPVILVPELPQALDVGGFQRPRSACARRRSSSC